MGARRRLVLAGRGCLFAITKYNKKVAFFAWRDITCMLYFDLSAMVGEAMKFSEFKRWLREQGVCIAPGKGSHLRASLNGKRSTIPDHGSKEIGKGIAEKIKKQLGLK